MKIKTLGYSSLRVTRQFENDRAEVVIEIEKGDKLGDVVREAKRICDAALRADKNMPADTSFETLYTRGGKT